MKKKATKEQAQQILSTVLMCMNCINTFAAPIAVVADLNKHDYQQTTQKTATPSLAYNYKLLPNVINCVDNLIFSKAEAFTEIVGQGGTTNSVSNEVVENGTQKVNGGGKTTNNIINNGGTQIVTGQNSNIIDTIVNSGGIVSAFMLMGGSATGVVVNDGGSLVVSYAQAKDVVLNGGSAKIGVNGAAIGTIINSGSIQNIDGTSASTQKTVINAGGVQNIRGSRAIDSDAKIEGGVQNIFANATARNVFIDAGGTQNVHDKGTAAGGTIGGVQNVYSGASITGTWQFVEGGVQNLNNGVLVRDAMEINGGTQNVLDGAKVSVLAAGKETKVTNGGVQNIESGGSAARIVLDGGTQNVKFGALATSVTSIGNGGVQNVYNKAGSNMFDNTYIHTINANGNQNIYNGGWGNAAYIAAGGTQTIYDGGTGKAFGVSNGGIQNVYGGTGAIESLIAGAFDGGVQNVYGGTGIVSAWGKGTQIVHGGSGLYQNDLLEGVTQIVSGGIGIAPRISSGGVQIVVNGIASAGYTSGNTKEGISVGGTQAVKGGTGIVEAIRNGGLQAVSGGTGIVNDLSGDDPNTANGNGGTQAIAGGIGSAGEIRSGGIQTVAAGAVGYADHIGYKGTQEINGGTGYAKEVDGTGALNHGNAQQVIKNGLGVVDHLFDNNAQQVISGGTGYIKFLGPKDPDVGGSQFVSGGTGIVDVIHGGQQHIYAGAVSGVANQISGKFSYQYVSGAIGSAGIIAASGQQIVRGGTAYAGYIGDDGIQYGGINSGGTQLISGGTGIAYVYSGGLQRVLTGANATDGIVHAAGVQDVQAGGKVDRTVIVGGTQDLAGTATNIKLYAGQQNVLAAGVDTGITIYGGLQEVVGTANNANIYDGKQVVNGGTANNTVLNGGVQVVDNGLATGTKVQGGMLAFNNAAATVENFSMSAGELRLGGNGDTYNLTGDSTLSGGLINMTAKADGGETKTGEMLNIANLTGNATFRLDVDLENGVPVDQVTIASSEVKQHRVQINNIASNISEQDYKILLITNNDNNANFVGAAYNNGGLFLLTPTVVSGTSIGENAGEWYMTQVSKAATGDALVLLDAADNGYALWRNTNDSMRSRLGELRANQDGHNRGVWARYLSGAFDGSGYDGRYNMYQLGFDQAANSKSTYGIAVDHSEGNSTYESGSGKDELTALSLYGVWTASDNSYTNLTLRGGTIKSDLKSYGVNPDSVDYRSDSYSVSVEYGKRFDLKRGYFIEPQAQFTLGHLSSVDYTTLRSARGHIDSMTSAIGRIGFALGQKTAGGDNWYIKANVLHEFGGTRRLELSSGAGGTRDVISKDNNYGDTWFEIGLGGNLAVGKNTVLYGDIERSLGGKINKKWQINAGLRCYF